jgi:5,10-methylenetetrahydromethanopterin reductase
MRHGDAQIPRIIIAAHGPRTIEVAGEVADGVLLQVGLHPGSVEVARQHLEAGAKRAGRDPNELEMILCATTICGDLPDAQDIQTHVLPIYQD